MFLSRFLDLFRSRSGLISGERPPGRTGGLRDNHESNNNLKHTKMARKTVITRVSDAEAQDGIIEFPQNRTLYADQFTDQAPVTDEEREGFKPKNMSEVFEHYRPVKEGVVLMTEDGGSLYEDFSFRQIKDFEDEQLIAGSEYLGREKAKIDAYDAVIRQLEQNKTLRNTLKDEAAKGALKDALRALIAELDDAE